MKGKVDGILHETFPAREPRITKVLWDQKEWDVIHEGLIKVANEIDGLSLEDVEKMVIEFMNAQDCAE